MTPSLTVIRVAEGNQNYTAVNGVLFTKDRKQLIQYPAGKTGTHYVIPAGVTSLARASFMYCKNLRKIECPLGLKTIEQDTFSACNNEVI